MLNLFQAIGFQIDWVKAEPTPKKHKSVVKKRVAAAFYCEDCCACLVLLPLFFKL